MGTLTADTAYDRAIRYADALGAEHGRNAASWAVINPDPDAARAILAGIDDGDPAVLDALPAPDLSGEWAGSLTGPELVRDAVADAYGATGAYPHTDEWFADVCDAYEAAFTAACTDAIVAACRYAIAD